MEEHTSHTCTMRRLRIHPKLRAMLGSVAVRASDLIYPLFVRAGKKLKKPIASMPGVFQYSPDMLLKELAALEERGLCSFMLFGVIDAQEKDEIGSHILNQTSVVAQALKAIKKVGISMLATVDVCFCEYTSHGHCGIEHTITGVDNAATVANLAKQATVLADAGADMIAPSGMMDGAVAAIRKALDDGGHSHVPIMAYSVKYASAFYGPFRDAAESAPKYGDRRQYQQDHRRDTREAIEEATRDIGEGADIVMVKPGLAYLDVVATLREKLNAPIAVYHVSGEYSMLKAASANGWVDYDAVLMETMTSFKRAGADIILTYAAPDILRMVSR